MKSFVVILPILAIVAFSCEPDLDLPGSEDSEKPSDDARNRWELIRLEKKGYGLAINFLHTRILMQGDVPFAKVQFATISGESNFLMASAEGFESLAPVTSSANDLPIGPKLGEDNFWLVFTYTPWFASDWTTLEKSSDGIHWDSVGSIGIIVKDFTMVDDSIGYYVDADGRLLTTKDTAKIFSVVNDTLEFVSIDFSDRLNGSASVMIENRSIRHMTADGGISWTALEIKDPAVPNIVYRSTVHSSLSFALSESGGLYRSDNRGISWQLTEVNYDTVSTDWIITPGIYFKDDVGYYVFSDEHENGYILKSMDAGLTWNLSYSSVFLQPRSVVFHNDSVFVSGRQNFTGASNHWDVDSLGYQIIIKQKIK